MRNLIFLITFMFVILAGETSCERTSPPPRAKGIPETAVWGGGPDGGSWYVIKPIDKKSGRYHCEIYWEHGGLDRTGDFVLRRLVTDSAGVKFSFVPLQQYPDKLEISCGFDGTCIPTGDIRNRIYLVPDGWIVINRTWPPFRILFNNGTQVEESNDTDGTQPKNRVTEPATSKNK